MSTYAIGDIQGCMEPLQCLLREIQFDPSKDYLWLAGDLINRGPDSLAVLRCLYTLRERIIFVLGNHDLHFLAIAAGQRRPGKSDTLNELLNAKDAQPLIDWLLTGKLLHHDKNLGFTMVHAGIPPQWNLAQAQGFAGEVEKVLQSDNPYDYLAAMYGNSPSLWSDNLTGLDRLRIITNYFTRMRFCTAAGELELETKSSALVPPPGYLPWFAHTNRKTSENKIIFGHWAALEGKTEIPGTYALDTGCVWGGSLTALRLEDEKFFTCDCPQNNFANNIKD